MGIGTLYKSEIFRFRDEKTGREVTQLTRGQSNNYHFYFTDNSFVLGDHEIYFMSDRASLRGQVYNLFRMNLHSGVIVQVTDEPDGIQEYRHTKTPDASLIVYTNASNQIKKLNPLTMHSEIIYEGQPGIVLAAPFISPDQKRIGMPCYRAILQEHGPNYAGFKELMYAVKKGWIMFVDLDSSRAYTVYEDTHWLGHFQFSPDDSNIAMFCHEGPWNHVHQRIWVLDINKHDAIPIYEQTEDDCVGHEFWTRDGLIFFDNRRAGHDGTITSSKTQATIMNSESSMTPVGGLADRSGKIVKQFDLPYYCNHYHANNDNSLLVGDAVEDLVLIDLTCGKPSLSTLCTHGTSWYTQKSHCHPTFGWNGDKILFTSDRDGVCNLYLFEL